MLGLNHDQLLGFLRHIITFFGGILVARGKLDPVAVESIGGAIITIVGLFFSFMSPEKKAPAEPVSHLQIRTMPIPPDDTSQLSPSSPPIAPAQGASK